MLARGHVGTVTRGQGANDERLSGTGQAYILDGGWQVAGRHLTQKATGDRMIGGGHFQVPGLGGQVSGAVVQVRVQVLEFARTRTWC